MSDFRDFVLQKPVNLIPTDMNQFMVNVNKGKKYSKIIFLNQFRFFFQKNLVCGNNILYKVAKTIFSEIEIIENWSMAVVIWLSFGQVQMPLSRMSLFENTHLIPLNDSTHQDHWPEI